MGDLEKLDLAGALFVLALAFTFKEYSKPPCVVIVSGIEVNSCEVLGEY